MMAFLQNVFLWVVPYLLVITVIITIHELGHFLTARAFGVAVDRFSIGFGPSILSRRDKHGIEWRIGALPIGGYVKFAGDENAASVPDEEDLDVMRAKIIAREGPGAEKKYLHFKPIWQRALVVAAGPLANFVLAIAIFSLTYAIAGHPVISTRIGAIMPNTPAAAAGFQVGDRLVSIDGRAINDFSSLKTYVATRAGVPVTIGVERAGKDVSLSTTPAQRSEKSLTGGEQTIGYLGLEAEKGWIEHPNPLRATALGVQTTWDIAGSTLYYLGRIVTGQVNPNQLHSMLGMAHASGEVTKQAVADARENHRNVLATSAAYLIPLVAFLSVSVGLLNLLPVPVLDGGHLLFYAYESIARRPASARVQAAGYRVGLALLLGLMLFATWNDLQGLRVFHFLGGLIS
jgi:regulator of sigma E protease